MTSPEPAAALASAGPAVRVEGLTKTYGSGETLVRALHDATFEIGRGELVVLLGPSGSGKTTTLNLIGAIEEPTGGSLVVDGVEVGALDERGRTQYRRDRVGFVFQFFNLVPTLTAHENVALVAELTGPDAGARAEDVLTRVGLGERMDHYPGQLSGGEQQRVAIARALVKEPPVLLCDEPTGALDVETGRSVLALLRRVTRDRGRTVLLVTHNSTIATMADRVLRLSSGDVVSDERIEAPVDPERLVW
ncbi:MAG: ABC transporter ATP-binding protein [Acidimicrobiia bacterium]|nr:ABC transporter ATP-binding protein [Acidimicrobiia bacterium]